MSSSPPASRSPNADQPIGVFDSGIGGLSVLRALRAELPHEHFIYFADSAHAPYGERDDAVVEARSHAVTHDLLRRGAKALVVACNTATAAAVHSLRAAHPALPIIGVEPALRPALLHEPLQPIGVMATRITLRSAKFNALLDGTQQRQRFLLQACDGLADAIESLDEAAIERLGAHHARALLAQLPAGQSFGSVVLGCTHYPLIAGRLAQWLGAGTPLIETGVPVARQTRRLLTAARRLADEGPLQAPGTLSFVSSGADDRLREALACWLPELEAA